MFMLYEVIQLEAWVVNGIHYLLLAVEVLLISCVVFFEGVVNSIGC